MNDITCVTQNNAVHRDMTLNRIFEAGSHLSVIHQQRVHLVAALELLISLEPKIR